LVGSCYVFDGSSSSSSSSLVKFGWAWWVKGMCHIVLYT
jgi:hypothetical protein